MKKSNFFKGALILTICGLIGKVIGAFYRIPFSLIVGAEGVGLYQLVYPLYTLMLTISTSGLPSSISKILSEQYAGGYYHLARKTFKYAMTIILVMSLIGSILITLLSWPVANLQGNSQAFGCYLAISPAVFFVGIIAGLRGYFQAKENMVPTAISTLIEQVTKLVFGLLFAYIFMKQGVVQATIGALVGVTLSEVIASIYMLVTLAVSKRKYEPVELAKTALTVSNKQIIKRILSIALPIALGGLIMPATLLIDSSLIVKILSKSMTSSKATTLFGLQSGVVGSLSNLPVVASVAVATAILPKISKENATKNTQSVIKAIKNALTFVMYVALPCAICFYIFSDQIILFLYGKNFTTTELEVCIKLIKYSSINIIVLSLAQVTASVLQGLGKVKVPLISLAIGAVVKIVSLVILVNMPKIHIYGAEFSDAICYLVTTVINLVALHRQIKFNLVPDMLRVGIVSVCVGVVAFATNKFFYPKLSPFWSLLIAGGITILIYLLALLLVVKLQKQKENRTQKIRY